MYHHRSEARGHKGCSKLLGVGELHVGLVRAQDKGSFPAFTSALKCTRCSPNRSSLLFSLKRRGLADVGPCLGKLCVNTNVIYVCKRLFFPLSKKKLKCTSGWCSVPVSSLFVLICRLQCPWEEQETWSPISDHVYLHHTVKYFLIWKMGENNLRGAVMRLRLGMCVVCDRSLYQECCTMKQNTTCDA